MRTPEQGEQHEERREIEGIDAAAAAGLDPIKINMVVKRGVNEHEIVPMARFFKQRGHILRFIEYMDVGASNGWRMDDVVTAREIVDTISAGSKRWTVSYSPVIMPRALSTA